MRHTSSTEVVLFILFLSPNDIVGAIIHSMEIMLSILFLSLNAIIGAIRNSTLIVLILSFNGAIVGTVVLR